MRCSACDAEAASFSHLCLPLPTALGPLQQSPLFLCAVYLRTVQQPGREIAALALGAEASSCFLFLPPGFWSQPDVRPLVASLGEPSSSSSGQAEAAVAGAGAGVAPFDGLVHVRFR